LASERVVTAACPRQRRPEDRRGTVRSILMSTADRPSHLPASWFSPPSRHRRRPHKTLADSALEEGSMEYSLAHRRRSTHPTKKSWYARSQPQPGLGLSQRRPGAGAAVVGPPGQDGTAGRRRAETWAANHCVATNKARTRGEGPISCSLWFAREFRGPRRTLKVPLGPRNFGPKTLGLSGISYRGVTSPVALGPQADSASCWERMRRSASTRPVPYLATLTTRPSREGATSRRNPSASPTSREHR
jgi:hypothetical protein